MSVRRPLPTSTPPLLDRLIDEEPLIGAEVRPGRQEVALIIREAIRRDLEVLLGARQRMLCHPDGADELPRSAIDFGLPASRATELSSPRRREDLRASIESAIRRFEPRLRDVRVALEPDDGLAELIRLSIEATLLDCGQDTGPIAFRAAVESRSGRLAIGGPEA